MMATTAEAGVQPEHDAETCSRAWFALRAAHDRVAACLADALDRVCGLGISDFEALLFLHVNGEESQRVSDLSAAVTLSQPALSRLVTRLETRGYFVRTQGKGDRRAVHVTLTADGRAVLQRAIPIHVSCIHDHLLNQVSQAEQATLVAILERTT